ncbi:MAG: phage major capsid protein [Actinomycetota bacterium]|nr:phage major capsid protein [Actinomycetota bacterium]
MAVPIVRPTGGSDLFPRELGEAIFERAAKQSVMQQIATAQPLTGAGRVIPVITGRPSAGWVSEAGRKPVSDMTLGTKLLEPKKLAVIVPFSKEYMRDAPNQVDIFDLIRPQIAEAFAIAFDASTIKGTSTPFTNFVYQTTNVRELGTATAATGGLYLDLVNAIGQVADEGKGYRTDTWVIDDLAETTFLGSVDTQGRPLFVDNVVSEAGPVGRMVGRQVFYTDQASTPVIAGTPPTGGMRGFGVDSRQLAYGVSSDIAYDITDQASIVLADNTTTLHLWQNNLVALLAETEIAFAMNDVQAAVRLTDNT